MNGQDQFIANADGTIRIAAVVASATPALSPAQGPSISPQVTPGGILKAAKAMSLFSSPAADNLLSGLLGGGNLSSLDPDELRVAALQHLQQAELDRVECRSQWIRLSVTSQRLSIKLQVILARFQGTQEIFVRMLQDSIRKTVVVESSALANIQYDIQMLFKVQLACVFIQLHLFTLLKSVEAVSVSADLLLWMGDKRDDNRQIVDMLSASCGKDQLVMQNSVNNYLACWDMVPDLRVQVRQASNGFSAPLHAVYQPPRDEVLRSDVVSQCESAEDMLMSFTDVLKDLTMPRLVRISLQPAPSELMAQLSVEEHVYGSAEASLHALSNLSSGMHESWSQLLDGFRRVVSWQSQLPAVSLEHFKAQASETVVSSSLPNSVTEHSTDKIIHSSSTVSGLVPHVGVSLKLDLDVEIEYSTCEEDVAY